MQTKKLALVTCYFQPNYGSQLQAFATQLLFDKMNVPNLHRRVEKGNQRSQVQVFLKPDMGHLYGKRQVFHREKSMGTKNKRRRTKTGYGYKKRYVSRLCTKQVPSF